MVTGIAIGNATALKSELDWFFKLLDTRIKLHFGHECTYSDIFEITPPELDPSGSMYGHFINHYDLTFAERAVFVLSLVPHIKPHLLDVFLSTDAASSRRFTEFGGRNGTAYQGFLPTGETALFLLAGDDVEKRLSFQYLFDADHFFAQHNILRIEGAGENEPEMSGLLTLSRDIIDLVTTGKMRRPAFSADFPARRLETGLDWDDLVLDPYTLSQVLEIKAWIEHGDELLNDLGLGRKLKPGYRALFYGPPGTGKTLTASLIGKVTGRDVYRIDLSMVVSKYIGETEKNLEKVFQRAEHKDWILFFDEADALFGKRTNINDAHDRFANQEISYLLQRVEDYAGVVILASNMRSNLDEAFTRRFQSIIHFPMPRQNDRLRLWNNAFSEKTPLEAGVDLRKIAAEYELSGGAIMNVVRYATLMTLKKKSRVISLDDILEGIRKELQKEGRTS
ncbi:MAG: ATP-binding protein [Nitrospirae bacterium]|nr:ATP-binding protein [Nitrospirota bacterium]